VSTNASLVNHTIGNYRVTSLLGEGGMGVVYLAQHPVFGRKVAIKLLHAVLARDPDIVARFFNEARAIHMVAHENIVEILDFGQTPDGQPYFIMEYLQGESLSDTIGRGPMPLDQVEAIGVQMCRALGAAHSKGIVHRDLKPHNVQLVIKADGALQVKILDFGVAKILQSPDGSSSVKTRTGSLMGTPLYMSPEQCKGAGVLDHRTDIYSLGVILFEMLSGRPPFNAEGVGELFAKHMLEEPPSLLDFAPNTPPHLAAAVMKSLAKDPAARFQSMDDFRKAIVGEVKVTAPASAGGTRRLGNAAANTMAQTISAKATTSTLSSASSEIDDELAIKPTRTKLFVAGGGALAVAVVAVVMLSKGKETPPAAPPAPPVATTTAPAVTPPAQPPPVAAKKSVTIRFEAEPAGAHVFRKKDDKDLGPVPVEIQLAKDAGKAGSDALAYVLRLPGYKERPLTADVTGDRTFHIALEKAPAAVDPKKNKPPAGPHHGPRRPRNPVDEDGLATPSF
jgi:serine/threonine protein kinase